MYAHLDDMAAARANMSKEHALKLHVVQHKYAAQIASHARELDRHARKLQPLHAKINAKTTAIAGADFANRHLLGSIAEQQVDNEGGCSVEGAGIVNVIDMAKLWPIAPIAWPRAVCRPRFHLNELLW
jgi:hypothetical protein